MRAIGPVELLVILGIAVLLFGGNNIPDIARGLSEGIRNFQRELQRGQFYSPPIRMRVEGLRSRPVGLFEFLLMLAAATLLAAVAMDRLFATELVVNVLQGIRKFLP